MLRPDPALPSRDLSWSTERAAELFERSVLPVARPGMRLRSLERRYTAYKPGKECLLLYALRLEPARDDAPHLASVTLGRRERLATLYARHYAHGDGAVLLSEPPCLVEFFPSDWKLPALAHATDPAEVGAALGRFRANGAGPVEVHVLRYRPRRRCVLDYQIGCAPAAIGKVYPSEEKVAEVAAKLRALGPQAHAERLRLPVPLASARFLLMDRVPGANLDDLLESSCDAGEAQAAVRVAAASLASFHRLRLDTRERRSLESELRTLRERTARMRVVAPGIGERADALLDEIGRRLPRSPDGELTLIHGDFKPSQLLLDAGHAALVDLDRACLGDPAIDVGNFLAVLGKLALLSERQQLASLGPVFLDEYGARSRRRLPRAARLFESLALVRMVVRRLERSPHAYARQGGEWRPLRLLDAATVALASEGGAHA